MKMWNEISQKPAELVVAGSISTETIHLEIGMMLRHSLSLLCSWNEPSNDGVSYECIAHGFADHFSRGLIRYTFTFRKNVLVQMYSREARSATSWNNDRDSLP